jgi:two-component system, OmpR family, sensor kinase
MIIHRLSLRWRVTGAFAGVLVLVLLAVGGFVWWRMSSVLDQALDRGLRARAAEVGALVDQPGLALFPPGGPTLEADENVAQILHADGTVVAASSFAGLRLVDPPQLHAALEGTVIWDRPGDAALDEDLRLLATSVNRSETYIVVVGSSLDERNEALTALLGTGLVGVAVALLAAVAAGYATAGLALSPVRAALTRQRQFVAEASHQLRTPLAVITTEVELAELTPDPATQAAALHSVGEEARRLTRLTDQLLLLVAHDERRLVGVRQQLAVPALLEAVAARHRRAVADHGRRITVTAESGLIAYADEDRLASALDALVENALWHGVGTVALTGAAAGGTVLLRVQDEGGGFASSTIERFRRGPGSTGSGLGLSIVQAVAEAHGGQASVGPGSSVTITLPSTPLR